MRTRRPKLVFAMLFMGVVHPLTAQTPDSAISLDSLLNVRVNTATRYDQTVQEAPASVSVITAEEIERYGSQTLAEVLATLQGFYTSYDLNYSYVGVRGFGRPTDYNNRILLLIDGQAINEPEYGSAPVGTEFPLPLSMIERVEVVRGPGSVLYGTGAMFAVVNVITKTGTDGVKVHASAEAGSLGRLGASALAQHVFSGGAALQVAAFRTEVQGADRFYPEFAIPGESDGFARGLDGDNSQGAYVSYRKRGLLLTGRTITREKFIPTAAWDAAFNHPDTWTVDELRAVGAELRHGLSARAEAFFGLSYHEYEYEGSYPYEDAAWRDWSDSKWARGAARLLVDLSPRNRVVGGVEFTRVFQSDYAAFDAGEEAANFNATFNAAAVYAQLESTLSPRLTAVLGASYDHRTRGIHFLTPRLAILITPQTSTTVKLLYGHAFRAPNPYELYSDGAELGFENAPVNLRPERIMTSELVLEQMLGGVAALSASIYHNRIRDLIDFVPDTSVNAGDAGRYMNSARSRGTGAELTLRTREWRDQSAFVSLSYQRADDLGTEQWLTNSPRFMARAGWYHHLHGRLGAGVLLQHESGRRTLNGAETDALTRVDLTLAARLLPELKLSGALRNAFDTEYAYPGGLEHRQNTLPQDGRTFVLRVDAQLR